MAPILALSFAALTATGLTTWLLGPMVSRPASRFRMGHQIPERFRGKWMILALGIPLAAFSVPFIPAAIQQALVAVTAAGLMGLVRVRSDLDELRIETRFVLRLVVAAMFWQVGVRFTATARPGLDFLLTLLWFAVVITAFDLRRRPDETELLAAATAGAAFLVIAALGGQFFVAPIAGALVGAALGLLFGFFRDDSRQVLVGLSPAIGTLIAAVGTLIEPSILADGVWRSEAALATASVAIAPAAMNAAIVIWDRTRNGLSPLIDRDDHLLQVLQSFLLNRRNAILAAALLGLAHGAIAVLLSQLDGQLVVFIFGAVFLCDLALVAFILAQMSRSAAKSDSQAGVLLTVHSSRLGLSGPLVKSDQLKPGTWVRRSALVWAHRGTRIPPHLSRTRVLRHQVEGDPLKRMWSLLLSLTVQRRERVPSHTQNRHNNRFDVVVWSKNDDRVLHIDTETRVVVHETMESNPIRSQRGAYEEVSKSLRLPDIADTGAAQSLTFGLLWGEHLLDADSATRVGALSSLLIDVIRLTSRSSQPASHEFLTISRRHRPGLKHDWSSYRTVFAPASQSLDNVALLDTQTIAWVESLPLVECSFHLPWFGVATRLARRCTVVKQAVASGTYDAGIRQLLELGGLCDTTDEAPWASLQQLPWTRVPIE